MNRAVDVRAEMEIYVRIGRLLVGCLNDYDPGWSDATLHVDNVRFEGAPNAYRMTLTATRRGGLPESVPPQPELLGLSQELDDLCFEQSGKRWLSYDFKLYQTAEGPTFECRYSYAGSVH